MCITPVKVDIATAPYKAMVACHNCWQCQANRVNDMVGRCIAEQTVSDKTYAVTFTYRDEGNGANIATLFYKDFQDFMKRLRFHGYKVRYMVVGEYGSQKQRAHWHAVLFFRGKVPTEVQAHQIKHSVLRLQIPGEKLLPTESIAIEERFSWAFWPHGMSYVQRPEYGSFKYLLKYALKEQKKEVEENALRMSKKPPLGYDYFLNLANHHILQDLSPRNPEYSFDHIYDRKGRRRTFWLQGRMKEIYLDYYNLAYRSYYMRDIPVSNCLEQREDKYIRQNYEESDEHYQQRKEDPRQVKYGLGPVKDPRPFHEYYVCDYRGIEIIIETKADGTISLYNEDQDRWEELEDHVKQSLKEHVRVKEQFDELQAMERYW